jgi:hypothetical protein
VSGSDERKERIRQYKETPRPAGIYVVRNKANGKWLIGSSADLPGMLNRQRFQLECGSHPDKELQRDWNDSGPDAFEFHVLDELKPQDEPGQDLSEDLRVLKQMWIERLTEAGQPLYPHSLRGT